MGCQYEMGSEPALPGYFPPLQFPIIKMLHEHLIQSYRITAESSRVSQKKFNFLLNSSKYYSFTKVIITTTYSMNVYHHPYQPSYSVLIHLSKGQLSKDHFVQGTLVQEDFCPRRHWSKETIVQGESLKH